MGRRRGIALASAAVLCGLLASTAARAQQLRVPARCQPRPKPKPKPGIKLSIDRLQLEGASLPYNENQAQFIATLEQGAGSGGAGWLDRVWNAARSDWRDRGYFQTVVGVKTLANSVSSGVRHVSLRIRVDPGPRFRLAEIRVLNVNPGGTLAFPNERLRDLVPLKPGEIVSVQKAKDGVEAIRNLYTSHGYIDLRATPDFQVNSRKDRISLFVMIDQGGQYRVGKIVVLGFGSEGKSILNSKIKSGDVFNWDVVRNFYKGYKWLMPADASVADDRIERNAKTRRVNLVLDFRVCPKPAKPGSPGEPIAREQSRAQ